jgi:uncharacterized protein
MFFETAGIHINPFIPPLVAFVISFFTSTGGVSGAFLILPFQFSVLGFTSPAVSSTNQLYNIIAIPSGVWRYIKEGRMVWPLTWIVIIGTLPGVLIGALLRVSYLNDPRYFKIFAGFVLLFLGYRLLTDLLWKKTGNNMSSAESRFYELVRNYKKNTEEELKLPRTKVLEFSLKRMSYEFYGETYTVPTFKISLVSFIVGIAGGAYGIGGGAIMAPFFVAFFGLPIYTVTGATLMGTFVTSVFGVIIYQILAIYHPTMAIAPDWSLGLLFGIGGLAGMYCGARVQKYMPSKFIKWFLCACIFFLGIKYILAMFG